MIRETQGMKQFNRMKQPEKIIKKQTTPLGYVQYQIQWKGIDEPTWEPEAFAQQHRELLEDFNYFALTGERYSNQEMDHLKVQTIQPRTAVKRASLIIKEVQVSVPTKKQKKLEKIRQLQLPPPIIKLVSQKQNQMNRQMAECFVQPQDVIKTIKLILTQDACLFQVIWKPRLDGVQPFSEYYNYEQFKMISPTMYMQFLECCLLECKAIDSELTFEGPGRNHLERIEMIRKVIEMNRVQ